MMGGVPTAGGQRSTWVGLVGGSPLLHIEGGPVAWFENWIPVDRAPDLTAREADLIGARLRGDVARRWNQARLRS